MDLRLLSGSVNKPFLVLSFLSLSMVVLGGCGVIDIDDCISSCMNKDCGDDGCGGFCGECDAPQSCGGGGVPNVCGSGCIPDCANKECGEDGCGGSCGECDAPQTCGGGGISNVCGTDCAPDCANKECGEDGCGGSCGDCDAPQTCGGGGIPFTCGHECDTDCVIASDDFEHGHDWEWFSGSGWEWHLWIHNGKSDVTKVVSDADPHAGQRHARLQGGAGTNKGYLSRKVNLQGAKNVQLSFWWKTNNLALGEYVEVKIYDGAWHTVMKIEADQADEPYRPALVDLSPYSMTARFYINFEASGLEQAHGQFFVDDVVILGTRPAHTPPWEKDLWKPKPFDSWDWTITGEIDTSLDVVMYDIDWEDAPQSVVDLLKSKGKKLACYIDVGTAENWRSDYAAFPAEVQGNTINPPWTDQYWLDARRLDILMPIMIKRFEVCQAKGFDMTQYDDLQGWDPESEPDGTGFPLSEQDIIDYTVLLADESKSMGMGAAFENNYNSIEELEPFTDWYIMEEGERWSETHYTAPYINAGKAVFAAEYTDNAFGKSLENFCQAYNSQGIRCIQKDRFLYAAPRFDCADY